MWQWDSYAFGETDPYLPTVNLRFPGQYFDDESGSYYNWHRYYNSGSGRYISSDPIGLLGGDNTYGYVGQNSFRAFDLLGLCKCQFADKNYDESRGFYFDKYDWPYLSYRFACNYRCSTGGSSQTVEGYVHEESDLQIFGKKLVRL